MKIWSVSQKSGETSTNDPAGMKLPTFVTSKGNLIEGEHWSKLYRPDETMPPVKYIERLLRDDGMLRSSFRLVKQPDVASDCHGETFLNGKGGHLSAEYGKYQQIYRRQGGRLLLLESSKQRFWRKTLEYLYKMAHSLHRFMRSLPLIGSGGEELQPASDSLE